MIKQYKGMVHVSGKKRTGRPFTVNPRRIRDIIRRRIDRSDGISINKIAKDLANFRLTVQSIVEGNLGPWSYRLLNGKVRRNKQG